MVAATSCGSAVRNAGVSPARCYRATLSLCTLSAKQQADSIFHGRRKATGWFLLVLVLMVRAGRPRSRVLAVRAGCACSSIAAWMATGSQMRRPLPGPRSPATIDPQTISPPPVGLSDWSARFTGYPQHRGNEKLRLPDGLAPSEAEVRWLPRGSANPSGAAGVHGVVGFQAEAEASEYRQTLGISDTDFEYLALANAAAEADDPLEDQLYEEDVTEAERF